MPCTHADRTSTAASDARAVWARVQVCACGGRISFCGNSADHNCRNPNTTLNNCTTLYTVAIFAP